MCCLIHLLVYGIHIEQVRIVLYLMQDHKQEHPVHAYSLLAHLRLDI